MLITDYSSLYNNTIKGTFLDAAADRVEKDVGMRLFDVRDSRQRTITKQVVHGQSGVGFVAEGSDLPNATGQDGDDISATQQYYGTNVIVTKHMRTFSLESTDGEGGPEVSAIEDIVNTITDDAFDKIDQSFADVLLFGFSTSYTNVYGRTETAVTPDGLSLFSAAHTQLTESFSNLCVDADGNTNAALSRESVIATRNAALGYTDANGILRPIELDLLIVGPGLVDLADRIIDSEKIQGSANNDKNKTTSLKGVEVLKWNRLAVDGQGTAKGNYWFMANKAKLKNTLKAWFAQKPMILPAKEGETNANWYYPLDYFYTIMRFQPQYLRGSTGAG